MKNLFFFNQRSNAAAQATECAYTTGQKFGVNPTKTSTFGRFATYIGLALVMLVTLGVGEMWAGAGWWNDGGVVLTFDLNGSDISRTLNSGSAGGATSLGTVTTSMTLKTFTANVWKDGSGNICSANMYYRVKNSGGTVVLDKTGTATSASYKSASGSNQVWENSSINVDLLNGGLAPGTYTFECWFKATGNNSESSGCGTEFWYSNNSDNYTYTFIVPSKNLTVAGAANGNTVSGSVEGITKGTAYTITASPTSGYAFSSWSATSGGSSITIASTSSATTTVTFNNYSNDATVTATFVAEETHDVTVSYKCGSTTIKTATTESAVGVSTPRSITAPDIDGYTFSSWTKGSGITIKTGSTSTASITFTSGASENTLQANYTAKTKVRLYYTNPGGFSTPKAYFYSNAGSESDSGWPGIAMTSTTECGDTYYYVEYYKEDHPYWDRVIFNDDGNNSTQTSNITFSNTTNNGQYNNAPASKSGTGSWSSTAPQKWALAGSMNSSSTSANMFTCDDGTLSLDITLSANTEYNFKVVDVPASKWYGTASATKITYENQATAQTISQVNGATTAYQTMRSAAAGTYTFTWDPSNKKVKVSYPTSYKVELEVGTVKGNANTPIIYHTSVDNANKVTSGNYVAAGTKVIFWVANSAAAAPKAGYNWWGFYNNAAGTGSDLPDKYTDASVSLYTINSIATNAHVYAVFGEIDYYITPYINGQGSVSPNGANAHIATPTSFTATPGTGYMFSSWEERGGSAMTIATPSAATTNVTTTAAATLQANFVPRWSVVGTDAFDGWSAYSTNLFTGYTKVSTKDVGYKTITLAANTNYEIKVYDRENSTLYGGSANQTIDYAHSGAGNEYTIATTSSPKSVFIQSAAGGTYTLNWNLTDKKIAVVYPTSWYITTGVNDADGGSFTAVDNSSNNVYGGKYVANSANVVFTATPNTGYNFSDWYSNSTCTTPYTAGTGVAFSGEGNTVMTLSGITADKTVYAKFTAKTYTVTLTRSGDGYNTGGTASVTATYNATAPSIASLPTAANGYAFMGYYTEEDGEGSQIVAANGTWQNVDGYTSDGKWVRDADTELFAYFKKAEITELTLSATVVAPGTEITVTPTISPTPVGTAVVCYQVQHSNGNPLSPQPTMSQDGNVLTLTAPANSATYKIQAKLCLNDCEGTELHTALTSFQVAGEHNVTVQYKCGDLTIKASQTLEGIKPLEWSSNITAPSITGYTFQKWVQGDGVMINGADGSGEKASATIQIKAVYDGTLTAMYTKRNMIYFYNTLGWNDVWVYFYNSDEYWDNTYGSGAQQTQAFNGDHKPYWEQEHGHMTNIEGTNIWYFDYTEAGYSTRANVAFTEANKHGDQWFYQTKAVRRGDHKSSLPMFVPLAEQTATITNNTKYYNSGYWMNYPESTGYTLKIYNAWNADKSSGVAREYAFPYSADKTMPLKLDVEFNNGGNAWFMVYRNDGTYHGKNYTVTQDYNDEQALTSDNDKLKLVTSASGIYTFTLTYHDNGSGTLNYYLDIDFPVAVGDYRILYSDNATWSNGAHVLDTWKLASDVINKNSGEEAKKDTVSFFVSKGAGITAKMKFQYVSAINASTGVVTWTDVASGSITIPSDVVTKAGVYNFIVTQPAGGSSISLEKAEAYTGNYYIRTDCAGNTKWDSYKTSDHLMTYSDYAETNSGYSHYYTHWVTSGTNVKFCIANDFSLCVSDTLEGDTYTTQSLAADANIRYMWNQSTNKISRAYIAGSGDITKRFLVLEGDSKMYDEDGNELTGENQDHDKYGTYLGTDNQVILHDDENFVYERTIQVKTKARGRLSAKYNNKTQYFIGSSGDFGESTTEELLGGETSDTKYSMRIVYDFKTNRLVKAYIPSGSDITEDLAINADIMLVREHQEAGQQLTFAGGSLSEVKTVYGVLRLNRWTLNNKEKTTGHSPVGDPKSWYERSFYWISFPFDVNLSDVFGFGTYGTHWAIEEYDGAERASKGYWADNSEGFWKIIENRSNYVLKAGKGYVLAIDLALMKDNNTDFWSNGIEQVELFFPSANNVENIEATDTKTTVPSHECTIDRRTDKTTPDINKDRTKADSHWNLIGVPSYANYNKELTSDGDKATITWHNPSTQDLPYLYEWNMDANTYTPQTSSTYPFKAMHAYMVQYHGDIYWSLASATPSSSVARRANELPQQNIEFRLELQQNNKMTDQTFVKLSDKEEVSANFAFDEDMMKEMNQGKANIYTMVEGYIPTAGNTLPMLEQTTVVPVGVKIAQSGDYTFSIPDGTSGVGVTLIDTENNIRTNLSAVDYTVSLESGQNDNRFVLEISPIQHIATEIETSDIGDQKSDVRKLLIDGLLYIVRDGKVYDARGARIE